VFLLVGAVNDNRLYRFDGSQFVLQPTSLGSSALQAIGGTGPDNLVLVGDAVWEYAQGAWQHTDLATISSASILRDVWVGGTDALAIGNAPEILRRTTSGWTAEPFQAPLASLVPQTLIASSSSDAVVLGSSGGGVMGGKLSGSTWSVIDVPDVTLLHAASGPTTSRIYASVTLTSTAGPALLAYDRTGWTNITSPDPTKTWTNVRWTPHGLYVSSGASIYRLIQPFAPF
jgi:hypothetical protein